MNILPVINLLAALAGLTNSLLVAAFRRFGPASWLLSLYLLPASVAAGTAGLALLIDDSAGKDAFRISFSCLLLSAPGGYMFSIALDRENYREHIRKKAGIIVPVTLAAPALAAYVFLGVPAQVGFLPPVNSVLLGPGGYPAGLYLLIVSVLVLTNLEYALRHADERVRWEIKFLALGLAGAFAASIYICSKILLYPVGYSLLPLGSYQTFPAMFLLSCLLVFASWRRSTGTGRIAVSQGLVYSSITLLAVGIYLIVSSLIARWASQLAIPGAETEALVLLVSALALGTILLWTGFRHRARLWLRRHIFAGRYDYRHFWMEATEKIRSVDSLETAARALAGIAHTALGAIAVTVWLRERDPNRLRLLAAQGFAAEQLEREVFGIVEDLVGVAEPVETRRVAPQQEHLQDFLRRVGATLIVPLVSSDRLVGILTVGADRSGQPYDQEAHDFLRVLAGHAAGELHKAELLSTLVEAKEAEAFRAFSTFLLHDLKNFASTLSLIAKNATRFQDNPEFQRDAFRSVHDTAEKMKRLCNSLRSFSGNLAANRRLQDLNQIVREVADSLSDGLGETLRLELGELPSVLVDPEEIARVLQNLVLNAREAIAEDGQITIGTQRLNGKLQLTVRDNGKGISPEFLGSEVFHPFHTTKSDGLGIGLFQCKKIIEAHGGTIEIDSELGKGTTVRVQLPCE